MPTDATADLMRALLRDAETIAIVGASAKPERASHGVMKFLQGKGYRCIPVNPGLAGQTLLGEPVVADLHAIEVPVDIVDVFRNSAAAGEVVADAIAIGAGAVWMQLGVVNEAAATQAEAAGLKVIMDHCPAQEWARLDMDTARAERNAGNG